MIVWMLLSCNANRLDTGFWTLEYQSPHIESFEVECENEQWKINVRTEHWTGNGLLWMANENRYERHTVYSVSADPEGERTICAFSCPSYQDWRDAQSGRSSGFHCTEQEHLGFFIESDIHKPLSSVIVPNMSTRKVLWTSRQ